MARKHSTRKLRRASLSNTDPTFLPSVILFIMGMVVASDINPLQDDMTVTLGVFILLITINVGLFRYMGLRLAFQRTHRIHYWTLKQKSIFYLYLFLILLMISQISPYGQIFALVFLLVLIYNGIRSGWNYYKIFKALPSQSIFEKRSKKPHITIEEIDKMEGKEFEIFLSELYDELGYFAEVTPHTDYGIDVLIIKDKIKIGIQAKCYGEGRTIGVEAVNEACGGGGYWKVHKKMVITNRYFTKKALITAESNNIEMIDRDGLKLLIDQYQQVREQKSIFSFFK